MKISQIITIILFVSLLAIPSFAQEELASLHSLADSFRGKLSNLGSFQAIYSLNGKEKTLYVTITVNRKLNYIVSSLEEQPTPSFKEMFIVLDSQPEKQSFTSYAYSNNKAIKYNVFPEGLTNSLNNPFGVLAFLAEQTGSEVSRNNADEKLDKIVSAPSVTLRLTKDRFDLQLGCQFNSESFSASWTELSNLTNSTSTKNDSNEVVFSFQDGHSISVSDETGLLIKDDYPNPRSPGDRYLQLHSFHKFDDTIKYEQLIPKYSLLVFENQPATQFEQAFTLSFLQSLGEQLASDDNFETILGEKTQEIQETLLPLIRKQIHQSVTDDINPSFTEKMKNEVIMPYYQSHLKKNPGTSFDDFLDVMMYEIKKDPKAIIPPEALEFTRELNIQSKKMLSQLSEESREPISKLMDISVPVVIDAFMLEFLEQTINGMRTSE
jgi:hypothetical protein